MTTTAEKYQLPLYLKNHVYAEMIDLLTDIITHLDETTTLSMDFFLEWRYNLIHHKTNTDVVRLLVRGYLTALVDSDIIIQAKQQEWDKQIEGIYWKPYE